MSNHSLIGAQAMGRRRLLIIKAAITLLIGIALFADLSQKARSNPYELDEVMYFNDTDSFDAFIRMDFRSPVWEEPAAYIQPPVSKYVYGAYLFFRHEDYRQVRDWVLANNNRYFLDRIDPLSISGSYMEPYIVSMRQVATIFTLITLMLIGIIVYGLGAGFAVSLLLVIAVSQNQLFSSTMLVAKPDAIYIPLLLGGIILFVQGLSKKSAGLLLSASVLGGLSMATILTGVLFFIVFPFILFLHYAFVGVSRKRDYAMVMIFVTYVGLLTWVIVNPTLYPDPITNTIKNIEMRGTVISYQLVKEVNQPFVITSYRNTADLFYCVFIRFDRTRCINGNISPIPIFNAALLLLGTFQLFHDVIKERKVRSAMTLASAYVTVSIIFVLLPFDWPRYYLPVFLVTSVLSAQGVRFVVTLFPLKRLERLLPAKE